MTDMDSLLEQLSVQLSEKRQRNERIEKLEAERTEIYHQIRELEKKQSELSRAISGIKQEDFPSNSKIRTLKQKIEIERLRQAEIERAERLMAEKQSRFAAIKAELDELNPTWHPHAMKHQWEAAIQAAVVGSMILADEMGLGKSLEAIMIADAQKAKKILVITRKDVVSNFYDEFRDWAPHRNVIPMEGPTPQMKELVRPILEEADEYTIIINYEALWNQRTKASRDFLQSLVDAEFDLVIIDEAHTMKNANGRNFDIISSICGTAKNKLPMTGTMILNSPDDMWTSLHIIDPETFNHHGTFKKMYCTRRSDGKLAYKPGGEAKLISDLSGRILQRKITDTDIILPSQHIREVLIETDEISEEQMEIIRMINGYSQLVLEAKNEDGENITLDIDAMIALITRQRQAAVWPGGIEIKEWDYDEFGDKIPGTDRVIYRVSEEARESAKLDRAVECLIKAKESGRRSVVFSQFKTALVELQARLEAAGLSVARFDGDTKEADRKRIKKDFFRDRTGAARESFEYDVVLANFKTGGVGVSFTEATYTLILDEEWNPAGNQQAYARTHRIGQTEETYVDILRIDKPAIDLWMKSVNERKQQLKDGLDEQIDVIGSLHNFLLESV